MTLLGRLAATKFKFKELPDAAKKALIQYKMREDGSVHIDLLQKAVADGIITTENADRLLDELEPALCSVDAEPSNWGFVISLVETIYNFFDGDAGNCFKFSYLEVQLSELIEHVSSYENIGKAGFDAFHTDYIKGVSLDRVHSEDDMWSVILQDFDDYEAIWDGNNRFHCAVRDNREKISVVLI